MAPNETRFNDTEWVLYLHGLLFASSSSATGNSLSPALSWLPLVALKILEVVIRPVFY